MENLKFSCPHCGQHIRCNPSMVGASVACPTCKVALTVPGPERPGEASPFFDNGPMTILAGEFRFACPHCQQHLKGKLTLAGRQIKCPACQHLIVVPSPSPQVARPGNYQVESGQTWDTFLGPRGARLSPGSPPPDDQQK